MKTGEEKETETRLYPVEPERLAVLYQRRYNLFMDALRLTEELKECFSRKDEVSAELLLDMRQELFQSCDENWQEIRLLGEEGEEAARFMNRLAFSPIEESMPEDAAEQRLLELRKRNISALERLRTADRLLSSRAALDRSWYAEKTENVNES